MNSKIKKGRVEFNDENYENALKYFDEVGEDDGDYMYVLFFKITCLMELHRYDDALFLIESLLEEDPDDELLNYEKIRCHIGLNEIKEAFLALESFEKIISPDNKRMLLAVSKFYRILGDLENALKYCNKSLEIDSSFEEALREKSLIGIDLDDEDMVDSCADKLLEIVDVRGIGVISVFLLKLSISKFDDCLSIVDNLGDDFDDDAIEMLKSVVYKEFSEKLGVDIQTDVAIPVDEAISLLRNYDEKGVCCGVVHGVDFKIV
ncbi:MAG: tetratricopeptide repeat protein [Methanobrevibacter sp.]|nr:tetratricopeptide repeat protein [Methanobrevibacter sp.]